MEKRKVMITCPNCGAKNPLEIDNFFGEKMIKCLGVSSCGDIGQLKEVPCNEYFVAKWISRVETQCFKLEAGKVDMQYVY